MDVFVKINGNVSVFSSVLDNQSYTCYSFITKSSGYGTAQSVQGQATERIAAVPLLAIARDFFSFVQHPDQLWSPASLSNACRGSCPRHNAVGM